MFANVACLLLNATLCSVFNNRFHCSREINMGVASREARLPLVLSNAAPYLNVSYILYTLPSASDNERESTQRMGSTFIAILCSLFQFDVHLQHLKNVLSAAGRICFLHFYQNYFVIVL